MATVNHGTKEIQTKLVYYGPGMCGKTSNLQHIHLQLGTDKRGEMVSLATPGERTLYFDFLPISLAQIKGYTVKFSLYTVPGQVYYNATRKLVLRGADGLVFVADSQWEVMEENLASFQNLEENLEEYHTRLDDLPCILQYNKRDLPNAAPVWYLDYLLNARGVPAFEATAIAGTGVFETLHALCRYVVRDLTHRLDSGAL